jgi:glycosyltransferase involved in cell wall biosynthesis
MRIPVSVVVLTKNEERDLPKCLRSLAAFDEIFVVDSDSSDATQQIARQFGAEVIEFQWNGSYPKKKQWALENLPFTHSWVLYVDADEEITQALRDEIVEVVAKPQHNGYFVAYDYAFLGRVLRHGHRVYKLILFDRHGARFAELPDLDVGTATEVEPHYQPQIPGTTGVLRARALHDDHDMLFQYFDRHNRYSDWEAVLRKSGALPVKGEAQPRLRTTLKRLFARMPFKGVLSFAHSYFVRLGFLDGRAGFHYAVAKAFYYWQIRVKQLELEEVRR